MVDVFIEAESAFRQGDVPRVLPVGDIDIVVRQQDGHGAAQQSGEMARHGRHDQHPRLHDVAVFAEPQQRTERRFETGFFGHADDIVTHSSWI